MKGVLGATVALAMLAILISSAQATIKIEIAEVQNGFAFVKGNGAERRAQITWEGNAVTTANNNKGGFSFNGAVPADCIGVLSDGVSTIRVQVLNCTPVSAAAPALVPRTGQTTSFATGDDGFYQAGIPVPSPRFTDNSDGTVTDNLTGLIWLKNANCFGMRTWLDALSDVNGLNNGECGLTDGSLAGDWRLPNYNELTSLQDLGTFNPALPAGHPFTNFVASFYWSSTTFAFDTIAAWLVFFDTGGVNVSSKTLNNFVTAVRGGS
jgi:hypothetical protein